MTAKSKKQALYFIKKAQEIAEEEGFKDASKALGPLRKKLEKEVLLEES